MKKSVCLSQDSNLGSLIYLYGLIQPIRGRNRVKQKQVSVVMWLAPRPSVRETRVQIPEQHGNLVKFILVWVFFNPSGILTQP